MSKTRNLSDLLDANGDVKSTALDNVPASDVVNDTSPQLGGDLASNGNDILMADNDQIKLGTSFDFSIRHNGTNSYIQDAGDGDLIIKSNGTDVKIIGDNDEDIAKFTWNDGVDLYFNNSKKLETTSSGATVTGSISVNDDTHDGITAKFINSNAGNSGADINLIKDSSSPASGDNVGTIRFRANDDGGTERTFASIQAVTEDASAGSSDVSLRFSVRGSATTSELMRLTSSGLHLGGTGSANALDDYEEGTFTAGFTGSSNTKTGYYTKIGRLVSIVVYSAGLNVTSTVNAKVTGLPFTVREQHSAGSLTHCSYANTDGGNGYFNISSTEFHMMFVDSLTPASTVTGNPKYVMMAGTYFTD